MAQPTGTEVFTAEDQLFLDTQELLGKLLAGEDITIRYDASINAPAVFDVINRVLKIAPLTREQHDLIPGLTMHEVGHALFTNPTDEDLKTFKKFSFIFNAIEDGYQERMICKKYPGGKKHLKRVFERLFLDDPKAYLAWASASKVVVIANTLNYNCKGLKYGYYRQYPDYVDSADVALLKEAEMLSDDCFANREALAKKVSAALRKYKQGNENAENLQGYAPTEIGKNGESAPQDMFQDEDEEEQHVKEKRVSKDKVKDKEDTQKAPSDDEEKSKGEPQSDNEEVNQEESESSNANPNEEEQEAADEASGAQQGESDEEQEDESLTQGGEGEEGDQDQTGTQSVPDEESLLSDQPNPEDMEEGEQGQGNVEGEPSDNDQEKPQGKPDRQAPGGHGHQETPEDIEKAAEDVDQELEEHSDELNDHHNKFEHVMGQQKAYELPDYELLDAVARKLDILDVDKDIFINYQYKNLIDKLKKKDIDAYNVLSKTFAPHQVQAKKAAQLIYTKFNMRNQASNLAKTTHRLTGSLDPARLAMSRFSDDVFLSIASTPNQPNHAYVVMLDWSSSMSETTMNLTHRIMELTYFAKLAGVELEVWLYTTGRYWPTIKEAPTLAKHADQCWNDSLMIKVLNTKQHSDLETNERLKILWACAKRITTGHRSKFEDVIGQDLNQFRQHGTNILEATVFGHGILQRMKAEFKTLFVLTDGADSDAFDSVYDPSEDANKAIYKWIRGDYRFKGQTIHSWVQRFHHLISDPMFMKQNERLKATRIICEFFKKLGQNTVGVSWNMTFNLELNSMKFNNNNINIEMPKQPAQQQAKATSVTDYIKMENKFIDEIVKGLL